MTFILLQSATRTAFDSNVCNPGRGEDYNMKANDIADALFTNSRFAMAIYINNEPSNPKSRAELSYNGKYGWFDEEARPISVSNVPVRTAYETLLTLYLNV
jgi:hypothetical protein